MGWNLLNDWMDKRIEIRWIKRDFYVLVYLIEKFLLPRFGPYNGLV